MSGLKLRLVPLAGLLFLLFIRNTLAQQINQCHNNICDVTLFGAKGNGIHVDTTSVRAATQALRLQNGGVLYFPPGTYLTAPFNITSNTIVRIDSGAIVLGNTNDKTDPWPLVIAEQVWPQFGHGSDCVPGTSACRLMHQAFVFGWHVHNVTLNGGGTIDANGHPFWKCARDLPQFPCNNHGRPHLMMISNATNIELSNLTIRNSPDWTLHMSSVDNLLVKNMHVINPSNAPNSDGIDLDCVRNAIVQDSIFSVGDDALCVKSGIDYFGRLYGRPSANILFRNITIGKGHGISIGSETSGGVSNVTFDTIAMQGTNSGPRIKSERGRGGVVSGITFQNIQAKDLNEMISITLNYHKGLAPTNATATPMLRDVMLRNITFVSGESAGLIDGLPESHIWNVTLKNVVFPPGVNFSLCDYVDQGTCEGTTNQCPSCFQDLTAAGMESGDHGGNAFLKKTQSLKKFEEV